MPLVDAVEIAVAAADDPVTLAVEALQQRQLGTGFVHYPGGRLGDLVVEEAYIYPPIPAPVG